jgi:hypothetical protein
MPGIEDNFPLPDYLLERQPNTSQDRTFSVDPRTREVRLGLSFSYPGDVRLPVNTIKPNSWKLSYFYVNESRGKSALVFEMWRE